MTYTVEQIMGDHKKSKIVVFTNDLSIQIKREASEGNLNIRATVTLSLLTTLLVIVLGLFIHDRFLKYMSLPSDYSIYPKPDPHYNFQNYAAYSYSSPPRNSSNTKAESEDWVEPKELWHSIRDEELFRRAASIKSQPNNRTRKLAFMFLTKGRLHLAPLWEMFFKGHERFYSIYIHAPPDYTYEPPESSVFYKRRIPSQLVQWGKKTMIDAERRLLANALLDESNERFILLSDTCIPIFNFTTIHSQLAKTTLSFLGLFDDPRIMGRGRYNPKMRPTILLHDWRKGSQWFEARRDLAITMVSDARYYPVFVEHCKPPCYMDEHYFPTLVNMVCPNATSNRSLTWVDWSRGGSHPKTYVRREISRGLFDHIRHGFNCTYNGGEFSTTMCFLFARKFHPNTLGPLLNLAPYLLS